MTTDLTGDFELDEEQLDWDVFRPDPDEDELAAEGAALEDESDLDLDDSDLDWEAALREEPPSETDGRSAAAFERIVDTVRRSTEERDSERAIDLSSPSDPDAAQSVRAPEPQDDDDAFLDASFEPELELELRAEFEPETEPWGTVGATSAVHAEFAEPSDEFEPPWDGQSAPRDAQDPSWDGQEEDRSPPAEHGGWPEVLDVPGPAPEPAVEVKDADADAAVATEATVPAEAAVATMVSQPMPPEATPEVRPSHARGAKNPHGGERSKVFTATVVLACLVLVVLSAVLAVRPLHRTTPAAPGPSTHSAAPQGSSSQSAARVEAATTEVGSATAAAQAAIHSMASFPTPANVATIVDPYISSLQLYEAVLSDAKVPPSASSEAATAESEASHDLALLDTIHGLPPIELGAFLGQVGTDTAQLQITLNSLEQSLGSPAS